MQANSATNQSAALLSDVTLAGSRADFRCHSLQEEHMLVSSGPQLRQDRSPPRLTCRRSPVRKVFESDLREQVARGSDCQIHIMQRHPVCRVADGVFSPELCVGRVTQVCVSCPKLMVRD